MLGFIKTCLWCFVLLVLKQVNAAVVATISTIHRQNCVPDVAKNLNTKVFNLRSGTNETRHIEWHEMRNCKCRLDASVCDNKERWKDDKCRCECKELIDKRVCDKEFVWNPNKCECECDKLCDVGKYLNYKNCKCGKKLVDKLTEKCTENSEEVKLAKKHKCSSCTLYIISILILFTINVRTYFVCFHWYFKKDVIRVMFGTGTEKII